MHSQVYSSRRANLRLAVQAVCCVLLLMSVFVMLRRDTAADYRSSLPWTDRTSGTTVLLLCFV